MLIICLLRRKLRADATCLLCSLHSEWNNSLLLKPAVKATGQSLLHLQDSLAEKNMEAKTTLQCNVT